MMINCKIDPTLTWKADWVTSVAFSTSNTIISNTKLYIPVVTQDNVKLLQ